MYSVRRYNKGEERERETRRSQTNSIAASIRLAFSLPFCQSILRVKKQIVTSCESKDWLTHLTLVNAFIWRRNMVYLESPVVWLQCPVSNDETIIGNVGEGTHCQQVEVFRDPPYEAMKPVDETNMRQGSSPPLYCDYCVMCANVTYHHPRMWCSHTFTPFFLHCLSQFFETSLLEMCKRQMEQSRKEEKGRCCLDRNKGRRERAREDGGGKWWRDDYYGDGLGVARGSSSWSEWMRWKKLWSLTILSPIGSTKQCK